MDLTKNTPQNIEYMINEIVTKIKMVNSNAVQFNELSAEMYEELCEIYNMVMKKNSFSPNEMQALAEELGNLRKS